MERKSKERLTSDWLSDKSKSKRDDVRCLRRGRARGTHEETGREETRYEKGRGKGTSSRLTARCCWQKYEQERGLGSHRLKYCQRFIIGRINGPGIPCIPFVSVPLPTVFRPFLRDGTFSNIRKETGPFRFERQKFEEKNRGKDRLPRAYGSRCDYWFVKNISSDQRSGIASTTKQFFQTMANERKIGRVFKFMEEQRTAVNRVVEFGRTTSRLIERMMAKFLRSMQLFQVLNCIWRTRGIEGRIEAVVNQPERLDFPSADSWRARTRAENERAGIYTTGFRFCSRCNRAASRPSVHFLWECSRLPRGVGPPCAACLSESKPGQSFLSPFLLLFFSFPTFLRPILFSFPLHHRGIGTVRRRRRKIEEKNSAIVSLPDHFAILSFRSIFLTRNEYFPPLFRVFLSPPNVHLMFENVFSCDDEIILSISKRLKACCFARVIPSIENDRSAWNENRV